MAGDASADLVKEERAARAGVEYVKNVSGYCSGHKQNNIFQPSQVKLSQWLTAKTGSSDKNELGGNILYRSDVELGLFFCTSQWHSHELGEGIILYPHWLSKQPPSTPQHVLQPLKGNRFYVAFANTPLHYHSWASYLKYTLQTFKSNINTLQENVRKKLVCSELQAVYRAEAIVWHKVGQPLRSANLATPSTVADQPEVWQQFLAVISGSPADILDDNFVMFPKLQNKELLKAVNEDVSKYGTSLAECFKFLYAEEGETNCYVSELIQIMFDAMQDITKRQCARVLPGGDLNKVDAEGNQNG